MIRLFSKIRYAQWRENKFSRYLLYAAGEISLVVIGILIALQVNNWNEERKARAFEQVMLQEMRENVRVNLERFRGLQRRLQTSDAGIHLFLSESQRAIPDPERLAGYFEVMNNGIVFTYNRGAYDSLKAGGLDRLSNRVLRSELIDHFDSFLPRHDRFIQLQYEQVLDSRQRSLANLMQPAVVRGDSGLLRIERRLRPGLSRDRGETMALMAAISEANHAAADRLQRVVAETEKLLAALDAEIEGRGTVRSSPAESSRKPLPKMAQ